MRRLQEVVKLQLHSKEKRIEYLKSWIAVYGKEVSADSALAHLYLAQQWAGAMGHTKPSKLSPEARTNLIEALEISHNVIDVSIARRDGESLGKSVSIACTAYGYLGEGKKPISCLKNIIGRLESLRTEDGLLRELNCRCELAQYLISTGDFQQAEQQFSLVIDSTDRAYHRRFR